jgi:hypothetical protein
MKVLLNALNGALVISENAGNITIALNDSVNVGGGKAAGIVSLQGQGSVVLEGKVAFDLGMAFAESHSPSILVPFEEGAQAAGDAAISSL